MFRVCLWLQGLYPYNRPYKDGVNYLAWFAWRFEASQEGQQSGGGCLFIACSTFHPENLMVRGLQFPGMKFPGGLPLYTLTEVSVCRLWCLLPDLLAFWITDSDERV